MVSVSGGGYVAGAFAQALTGADTGFIPREVEPIRDPSSAFIQGTVELDHLRRLSSYIASTAPQLIVALGVLARGLLATLTLVYGPAVFLGAAAAWFYHMVPVVQLPTRRAEDMTTVLLIRDAAWWALALVTATAGVFWLLQLLKHGWSGRTGGWRKARRLATLWVWQGIAVAGVVVGIPLVTTAAWWVSDLAKSSSLAFGATAGSVLTTYLVAIFAMVWRKRTTIAKRLAALTNPSKRFATAPAGLMQLAFVVGAVALVVASWLLIFGLTAMSTATALTFGQPMSLVEKSGWLAALIVVILLALSDETSMSLHPFYRRRLASAFAVRTARMRKQGKDCTVAIPYSPYERTALSDYGKADSDLEFPEFLFAAAANLSGEARTPPGNSATSFVTGAEWVGGPDVGWVETQALEEISPLRLRRDLTMQGAVALSGAAFATSMGRFSRWYQVLFALTGARLGAWLPNPAFVDAVAEAQRVRNWTMPGLPRTRRVTCLLRELFNVHPIEERLLQVTDGGHYENLGIVELLRRRCRTIYCVDGGGDSPPTAKGLAQAIALAESELGVTISLDDPFIAEPGSGALPNATPSLMSLQAVLARSPVITGRITYPQASGLTTPHNTGRLIVGRALLWSELPYWLLSYALWSPVFPHDSTGDQFFGDDEFTAYLQLGREVGRKMRKAVAQPAP